MYLTQQWSALVLGDSNECIWIYFSVLQWLAEINIGSSSCKEGNIHKRFSSLAKTEHELIYSQLLPTTCINIIGFFAGLWQMLVSKTVQLKKEKEKNVRQLMLF